MARAPDLLRAYRDKRDFERTAEPQGEAAARGGEGPIFVVQKHDATRLHYDFRLEHDGVLKSWAVTKGPSLDPADKRLAVRTEDHPLAYAEFEGVIPKGEYGGGSVMLWDRGAWTPEGDPDEGLAAGKLVFTLEGERMKGRWSLVRMRGKAGEKRENWLLIKSRDEVADARRNLLRETKSVASGRTMKAIADDGRKISKADLEDRPPKAAPARGKGKAAGARGKAAPARARGRPPKWREPQLATLVDAAPEGDELLVEMKYDGYRALIAADGGAARIWTRNGKDWTERFPAVARAAAALDLRGALLDGEIVAFDASGRTDFSTLQKAVTSGGDMACFVFDLLALDGEDLTKRPLRERKARLRKLLEGQEGALLYSEHVEGRAGAVLDRLCAEGHEGVIVKRADRHYRGGRSRDWLKVKCGREQEFVVGGWSPSDKAGRPFSSLLLGVQEGEGLRYAGRVGSGFDAQAFADLAPRLEGLARRTSPFADLPRDIARDARFVTPKLVAQASFAEFTADGHVRHAVFRGLREDKPAKEVRRETPARGGETMRDEVAGVRLTHPEKLLWKGQGVSKADLAQHYERAAGRMIPLIAGRPLSLVRCPEGRARSCFYQKHAGKGFPKAMGRVAIAEKDGGSEDYMHADDLAALVAGVQMGTLEYHVWGARTDDLERPDRLVIDLDPGPGVDFAEVRAAAREVRGLLADLDLASLAMITGGKGIHVVVPLVRRAGWEAAGDFAKGLAKAMARAAPERFVSTATKSRREGRIYVDWLRNRRGATAVAPWSTRAREGCPVATPVAWDELDALAGANVVSLDAAAERLQGPDPWAEAEGWRQSLSAARLEAMTQD